MFRRISKELHFFPLAQPQFSPKSSIRTKNCSMHFMKINVKMDLRPKTSDSIKIPRTFKEQQRKTIPGKTGSILYLSGEETC